VVIPAYNAEKFIAATVRSALAQAIDNCEILVVNDGSTDRTAEVLSQFSGQPAVKILTHPGGINRGTCASRRLALQQARGEFIAFLDADDEFLPGKLERHIGLLREKPDAILVHSAVELKNERAEKNNEWTPVFDLGTEPRLYDLTRERYFLRRNFICNSTIVCRRSAIRPDRDLPASMVANSEDWVLINCLAPRGLFYYDPKPSVVYLIHPSSYSTSLYRRPGLVELNYIEFYLTMIPRLPGLFMKLRAVIALLFKAIRLARVRNGFQQTARDRA
jgi:glycosyltransferase involved in cell wall biosynthesis